MQNHHTKTLHNDSLNARILIGDANCSPPVTTNGSVCALAAGNIPGVQHTYTAGIGKQYGARMATAQTGLVHPRFATDCVSETLRVTVAEVCIYSLNMIMIIVTFMLRTERGSIRGRGKRFFSSPNVQTSTGVYTGVYLAGTGDSFPGVTMAGA
jgi:hypothetical protein